MISDMKGTINLLDDKLRPGRVIWFLAWPTILEQLLHTFVHYVDTAMVGSLGPDATASIAVSASFTWLVSGIFEALGIGCGVLAGHAVGAKDGDRKKTVIRHSLLAALVCGVLITAAVETAAPFLPALLGADMGIRGEAWSYLAIVGSAYLFSALNIVCSNIIRCSGDSKTPMFINLGANVLNLVLNFMLIYPTRTVTVFGGSFTMAGAGLGVRGAAIATAVSIALTGSVLLIILLRRETPFSADGLTRSIRFRPQKSVFKDMARYAYPVALGQATISTGQMVMTAIVTNLGTAALAAHHLAITAEAITYMPVFGFSAAVTTLVSQSLGANRPDLARRFSKYCIIGGILLMSGMGVILYFGADALIGIFTPDAGVIRLGGSVLRIEALAQPFFALSMVIFGVMRSTGDGRWTIYISVIGMWAVRLTLAFLFTRVFQWGLAGAWVAMVLDLFTQGMLCLWRFASGKCLPKTPLPAQAAPDA